MNDITYGIVSETYFVGNQIRVSYGIVAYSHAECDGGLTIIASVHDITDEKESSFLNKFIFTSH